MHMADALVVPIVAGTMYACSTLTAGYSINKIKLSEEARKIPVMGVMGAFVFAAQMINFTIPGTGSSGHLGGAVMLSAILGPYAAFITMIGVLMVQCLLFADGGLLALGCNIWNMAFYGCFISSFLIWKPIMGKGFSKKKIMIASILASIVSLQLGAFSVVLETTASRITELPFVAFLSIMQPIHLAIGVVEGLITALVLIFLYEARPELLWSGKEENTNKTKLGRLSFRKTIAVLVLLTVIISGIISLFASAFPDGLEWSISKVAGGAELENEGGLHTLLAKLQEKTALFPDYAFRESDAALGTSFSGILGGVVVLLLCILIGRMIKWIRKRRVTQNE